MKRIICIFSVLVVFSLLLSGCAAILSEQIVGMGINYNKNWATNNFPIGATENEILQRLGSPKSKSDNVWFYLVPGHLTSLQNSTVAVFFFEGKIITWLVYYYASPGSGYQISPVRVVAQTSYKTISIGASEEKVLKELGEPLYRGSNIWYFWKEPVIKYDFWGTHPVENTMQVIILYEKRVIAILCFSNFEYYGKPLNLSFTSIILPARDREGAKDYQLKQNKGK